MPDGIIHVVEGAGGNWEFDGNEPSPRGLGSGIDQDDSATGTGVAGGNSYPQGPESWLDTHLTNVEMASFDPGAGKGPKITVKFKAKVFSFGHIVVNGNKLTHYQISEPLLRRRRLRAPTRPLTGSTITAMPLKDPIPDTVVNPATGQIAAAASQDGSPALLDKWTIEKPDLDEMVTVRVAPPKYGNDDLQIIVKNRSPYALNGAQLVLDLPRASSYAGPIDDKHSLIGDDLVLTVGRIGQGEIVSVNVPMQGYGGLHEGLRGELRSATALPIRLGGGQDRKDD